ncbi:MAG: flavodoxin [Bacillota bacterium]|nr:flavodoxin [Bacillota bacterium]
MSKIVMVYLSNTGNTESMANEVQKGIEENGGTVDVFVASEADADKVLEYDTIVLGCPACGAEELDEEYIEPLMQKLEEHGLDEKKIALFGSYGWGGGEYMQTWVSRVEDANGTLVADPVVVEEDPADVLEACVALGKACV